MDWAQHFRNMNNPAYAAEYNRQVGFGGFFDDAWDMVTTPVEEQVSDFISKRDNLNAVNTYIHSTPIKTDKARSLASDWSRWWDTTGDPNLYTVKIDQVVWDEARNRRLAFDLANAVTKAEAEQVHYVATTGQSSEQMEGLQDRRDPETGGYYVPPPEPEPMFPSWVMPVFIGAIALGVGISVVPMIRKLVLPV